MANFISSTIEAIQTFGVHTVKKLPEIFQDERQPVSYDMLFTDSKDGCARYDDVWGG